MNLTTTLSKLLVSALGIAILLACNDAVPRQYAIRDFRAELRPILSLLVNRGFVGYDSITSEFRKIASHEDLTKMLDSEHPLLRATAIREKLDRDSLADNNFLRKHLTDTAVIWSDAGEWGIECTTVADDMLYQSVWRSDSDRLSMVREVILNHNYLNAAYHVLSLIEPETVYYKSIHEMATCKKDISIREAALLSLSHYRKKEDIPLIKQTLLIYSPLLSSTSFQLMENYPDSLYREVLEKYFDRNLIREICRQDIAFAVHRQLQCLASFKNQFSAAILNRLYNLEMPQDCARKWRSMKSELIKAVWKNKCDAYSSILKSSKPPITITYPYDPIDTSSNEYANYLSQIKWRSERVPLNR